MRIEKAIELGFTHSGKLLNLIPVYFKIEDDVFTNIVGKNLISTTAIIILDKINNLLRAGWVFSGETNDLSLKEQVACSKENRDVKVI